MPQCDERKRGCGLKRYQSGQSQQYDRGEDYDEAVVDLRAERAESHSRASGGGRALYRAADSEHGFDAEQRHEPHHTHDRVHSYTQQRLGVSEAQAPGATTQRA
jgi:hypothetical protein